MPRIPEIIGHGKQCAELIGDIAYGNVSHAYLFLGQPHLGKFTIARWFALRLLLENQDPATLEKIHDQIARMIHPDFLSMDKLWIEGFEEDWSQISQSSNIPQQHRAKAPTAKTDTISIEDVRVLHERLLATGSSKHLCCLIRSIDRMLPAAANAFLKILEEPPPRVVFILTSASEHALLPTVVSRTRILRFHPIKPEEMSPLIKDQNDEDTAFAIHLSGGAPGKLIALLDNPDLLREHRQLHAQAKQFWQARNVLECMQWIMPFAENKQNLPDLIRHLGDTLKEIPDPARKSRLALAYSQLVEALHTNAHRGLLLERFSLAVGQET